MPPLDDVLATFIRGSLRSVWSLEVLLLLRRQAPQALSYPELVRELRASGSVVEVCAQQLELRVSYHASPAAHVANKTADGSDLALPLAG